jgi:hypothetical protein
MRVSTPDLCAARSYYSIVVAVIFRLRTLLRRGWVSTLVMAMIVAVLCAVPMTVAAGAHRTGTAPDRYVASIGGAFDVMITQEQGSPRHTSDIASLPGVAHAESSTFIFGGLTPPDGSDLIDALVFAGSHVPSGLRLIDGREPDTAQPGEFVASQSFVSAVQARLGDTFTLLTLTQEQADVSGFAVDAPEGRRATHRSRCAPASRQMSCAPSSIDSRIARR